MSYIDMVKIIIALIAIQYFVFLFTIRDFMVGRESGNRTIMIPRENFGRN